MTQVAAITGLPYKRKQSDELLARLGFLPQILSQQTQAEYNKASIEDMEARRDLATKEYGLQEQRFENEKSMAKKTLDLQEESESKQMGIKAGGFGFSLMTSDFMKDRTFGGLFGMSQPSKYASSERSSDWWGRHNEAASQNSFWSTPIAPTLAGGLMGFGAGSLVGGKNKVKRSIVGAGVGGLASYFGSGGNWFSAAGGGILGGLGGLL